MRIHHLYCDADEESHFCHIEVQWTHTLPSEKLSERRPATGVIFGETAGDDNLVWHCAPRRQYIVNLDAGVELTASDGERRVIGAGEVILVEDTTEKGHRSKAIAAQVRRSLFIPVE